MPALILPSDCPQAFILRLGAVSIDRFYHSYIQDKSEGTAASDAARPSALIERAVDCDAPTHFHPSPPPLPPPSLSPPRLPPAPPSPSLLPALSSPPLPTRSAPLRATASTAAASGGGAGDAAALVGSLLSSDIVRAVVSGVILAVTATALLALLGAALVRMAPGRRLAGGRCDWLLEHAERACVALGLGATDTVTSADVGSGRGGSRARGKPKRAPKPGRRERQRVATTEDADGPEESDNIIV